MKNNQQGFTLIELMIVVAIIAILAAIALPQYRDYTAKADITNAIGGLAGEKIKIAENHSAGVLPANICNGVATGVTCAPTTGILTGTSSSGGSSVTLTPTLDATGAARITWACAVVTAKVTKYEGDPCGALL